MTARIFPCRYFTSDLGCTQMNSRIPQIEEILNFCDKNKDWFLVQSNPCFEVWLYFHKNKLYEAFEGDEFCKKWKKIVNESFKGGFDNRRHPILIKDAVNNSRENFKSDQKSPTKGSTEVYQLGESMIKILGDKIEKTLLQIQENKA